MPKKQQESRISKFRDLGLPGPLNPVDLHESASSVEAVGMLSRWVSGLGFRGLGFTGFCAKSKTLLASLQHRCK